MATKVRLLFLNIGVEAYGHRLARLSVFDLFGQIGQYNKKKRLQVSLP
ncbi:MAG: hypothetical protein WCI23_02635 [Chlorobiaceae bacterium]